MSDRTFRTTGSLDVGADVDLEACHTDPIHRTASIQRHGSFLQVDPEEHRVFSAAANLEDVLGAPAERVVEGRVESLFESRSTARIDRWPRGVGPSSERFVFEESGGHGSVVAEEKRAGVESCFGQRFPASDIPEPARRLYRKNRIRYVPDVDYDTVPIPGPDGPREREELDLTYSLRRGVPEVHRQYLRNIGAGSSLSVSLLVKGERLREATRASDVTGRYGGEEFALLLPETAAGEAGGPGVPTRRSTGPRPGTSRSRPGPRSRPAGRRYPR